MYKTDDHIMGATEKNKTIADGNKKTIFERLFKENYTRLYYYALSFIPDPETCKDIVSESFRLLWERFDSIKHETVLPYMFAHVHNLCIDHMRHQEVENSYAIAYLKIASEMNSTDWSEHEEKMERILKIIDNLPPQTKFVLEQCYLYKKKYKEVAEILGLTESGVRKHIMKGLNIIRNEFSVKYKKRQ